MSIHLYQSKKVQRYLDNNIYDIKEPVREQIDPLLIWYVDVFFIQRKRYLIIANPLTKFTFFIFRYSKKSHPNFLQAFKNNLSSTLRAKEINPQKYLEKCDVLIPLLETNKSASAHLSSTKVDYKDMIATRWHKVYPPDDELFYNQLITDNLVSFDKRDYDYPARKFHHELILRRWN